MYFLALHVSFCMWSTRNLKDLRCIIFVERIITAIVLRSLLNELLPKLSGWRTECTAGHASVVQSQSRKIQNKIVEEFRKGVVSPIFGFWIVSEDLKSVIYSCKYCRWTLLSRHLFLKKAWMFKVATLSFDLIPQLLFVALYSHVDELECKTLTFFWWSEGMFCQYILIDTMNVFRVLTLFFWCIIYWNILFLLLSALLLYKDKMNYLKESKKQY